MSSITADLPRTIFLHCNATMGVCNDCFRIGCYGDRCNICGKKLEPVDLLYPIKEKNYEKSLYIKSSWNELQNRIDKARMITFWGYSAPKSDQAALSMMEKAFKTSPISKLRQVEIINIAKENELISDYKNFIYKLSHTCIIRDFYESQIAANPRRSCDCLYENTMLCMPSSVFDDNGERIMMREDDDISSIVRKLELIEGKGVFRESYLKESLHTKSEIVKRFGWPSRGVSKYDC